MISLPLSGVLLGVFALLPLNPIARAFFAVAAVVTVLAPFVFYVETFIGGGEVRITVFPLFRRRFDAGEIEQVEVVPADNTTVRWFGGWEGSRSGLMGAFVSGIEGDRQVGNKAIRMTLAGGRVRQVGTWKPKALVAALESARQERLHPN